MWVDLVDSTIVRRAGDDASQVVVQTGRHEELRVAALSLIPDVVQTMRRRKNLKKSNSLSSGRFDLKELGLNLEHPAFSGDQPSHETY